MLGRVVLLCLLAGLASAQGLSGKVTTENGAPAFAVYVGLMDKNFAPVADFITQQDGVFTLDNTTDEGFLVVQPSTHTSDDNIEVFSLQPRIFKYAGEQNIALKLPAAASLILDAYDANGKRMLWEDFEKLGKLGGQFSYATNLMDESIPMACWPVHSETYTGMQGGPREKGLPALLVAPGQTVCANVLFWPTKDYGKLMLRADNAGKGFTFSSAGESRRINVNVEFARTAVAALEARAHLYLTGKEEIAELSTSLASLPDTEQAKAQVADSLLSKALRLRDELEIAYAKSQIEQGKRKGSLVLNLPEALRADAANYKVTATQISRDFLFGVYEGSPYNAGAYEAAREAGFDYATILPAWNWTQSPKAKAQDIDKTFGISALKKLGYRIKAHGVLWLQGYGILPDFALSLDDDALQAQALEHQKALLEVLTDSMDIVEVMNEPANTNVPQLPTTKVRELFSAAAENVEAIERPSLVNSPHEFSFGAKYWTHNLDGQPSDPFPQTYSSFLTSAQKDGLLEHVDIIGVQCYPGMHFNEDFGGIQGPAYTPAFLMDTLRRYARYGKDVHITELSFPSSYDYDWFSGYWREPWTADTQADYAEMVYTMAYADPVVHSITWWDITDAKPAVLSGGLVDRGGKPKPAFERLSALIGDWNTPEIAADFDSEGASTLSLVGGEYEVEVSGPNGFSQKETVRIMSGWRRQLDVADGG